MSVQLAVGWLKLRSWWPRVPFILGAWREEAVRMDTSERMDTLDELMRLLRATGVSGVRARTHL